LAWARAGGAPRRRDFRQRWADNEIAALWQALSFRVEYRCFNCVATCPAEIEHAFHDDRQVRRRYLDETLKPLTVTRAAEDTQFVIDTPTARERHGIPPGEWRTPVDRAPAGRAAPAGGPWRARPRRGRAADQPAPHPYPERGCHDALAAAVLPPDGIARARLYDAVGARRPRRRGMGHAHRRRALRGGSR